MQTALLMYAFSVPCAIHDGALHFGHLNGIKSPVGCDGFGPLFLNMDEHSPWDQIMNVLFSCSILPMSLDSTKRPGLVVFLTVRLPHILSHCPHVLVVFPLDSR